MTDISDIIAAWREREQLHPWPADMEDMEEFFDLDADDFDFALVWAAPAMADRIEALEAENARLRKTVEASAILGNIVGWLGGDLDKIEALKAAMGPELIERARAALGETSDD